MSKLTDGIKADRAGRPPVPKPPSTCMVTGCNNDTDVVVMLVRTIDTNRQRAGNPGRFVFGSKGEWNMKDGYRYEGYVTRCGKCYAHDVERYTHEH